MFDSSSAQSASPFEAALAVLLAQEAPLQLRVPLIEYDGEQGPPYAPHWSHESWLAHLQTQPLSGALADELSEVEQGELAEELRLQVLALRKALRHWSESRELVAAQQLVGPVRPKDPAHEEIVGEYAALYRVHRNTAIQRIAVVRESLRLTKLTELLKDGAIDRHQLDVVAAATMPLRDKAAAQVDLRLAERAPALGIPETRQLTAKAVKEADPERSEDDAKHSRKRADVTMRPHLSGDGADLLATGPAADIALMMAAINAAVGLSQDDNSVTAGRRRFDTLRELIHGGYDKALACNYCGQVVEKFARGSKRRRAKTQVVITIPGESLLGESDAPGHLCGYGPIPASEARRMALREGTVLRRLFFDPTTGIAADLDPKRYRLTRAEAEFLSLRDGVCTAPGCTSPAATCESDHRLDVAAGGESTWENLQSLCNPSHDDKTQHGWIAEASPYGGTIWISPLGATYDKPCRDYRVDTPAGTATQSEAAATTQSEAGTATQSEPEMPIPPPF